MTVKAFLILVLVNAALCQRRLVGGKELTAGKAYMVYIVWNIDKRSPKIEFWSVGGRDDYTLCGGVLLNPRHILTSAACMLNKPLLYAVAGYRRYVPNAKDPSDKCLDIARRRVIWKCFHKSLKGITWKSSKYFENTTSWTNNDYSVAKVDKPYDFTDKSFLTHCSYIPSPGKLHYGLMKDGTDVIALGWGSPKHHRPVDYYYDVNQKYLMSISTVIIDKNKCKAAYEKQQIPVVLKLCTDGPGRLEPDGTYLGGSRRDNSNNSIENEPMYVLDIEQVSTNDTVVLFNTPQHVSRRNGPCQNDHGGPLVAWIEGVEYVVGIIIGYLVNEQLECVGPYIYRSLYKEQSFIQCSTEILNQTLRKLRRCDEPPEVKGYRTQEEYIKWD